MLFRSRKDIVELAQIQARRLGINEPPGALDINRKFGTYEVGFFNAEEDHAGHGEWGWQPAWLYLDGQTGELIGYNIPGTGSWGDHFVDLQFPIHSGRLLGTPGKILVSLLGVVIAMLCVTGVLLWARRYVRNGAAPTPKIS